MNYTPKQKRAYARNLKNHATAGEKSVRWYLFVIGYKFQVYDPTGFLPDFYSPVYRVAIEVDGSVHRNKAQRQHDRYKDGVRRKNKVYTLRVSDRRAKALPISVMIEALLTGVIYRVWRWIV